MVVRSALPAELLLKFGPLRGRGLKSRVDIGLAGGGSDMLQPEEFVPDALPRRVTLCPRQVQLLDPHVNVDPLRIGGLHIGVIEERLRTEAESVLDGPALGDRILAVDLAGEILNEIATRGDDVIAAVNRH